MTSAKSQLEGIFDDLAAEEPDDSVSSECSDSEPDLDDAAARAPLANLIAHLPVAEDAACATFHTIEENIYLSKGLGRIKLDETMVCDCFYDPDRDTLSSACTAESGCINRLTQVECLASECRSKTHCQNQRFQKRQYAPIQIVQTEHKGFGVRAAAEIAADTFIYEYVGEVIGHAAFLKRMQAYYDEGIIHFYFMALQKDEFIDATKRGGKGRFLNHSCNPNCYVAKWTIGKRVRMGIFAKRNILQGEELTFNYNVDRYGHDAQECFCGETCCVGFIGGKTQTDIAGIDDLYLDALGIDPTERKALKGSKNRKSKRLDEDFIPVLRPIQAVEVNKVAIAIKQASANKGMVSKLIQRVRMTEDIAIHRQLMRLHGFNTMNVLLHEYEEDPELLLKILEILHLWPLLAKNKLVSTNIEETVTALAASNNELIQISAQRILAVWQELKIGYRIPRGQAEIISPDDKRKRESETYLDVMFSKRQRIADSSTDLVAMPSSFVKPAPVQIAITEQQEEAEDLWKKALTAEGKEYYYHVDTREVRWDHPYKINISPSIRESFRPTSIVAETFNIETIIRQAQAEAHSLAAAEAAKAEAHRTEVKAMLKAAQRKKAELKRQRNADPEKEKDRRMLKLFSKVVVKTMSKYKDQLEGDQFKRRAKEYKYLSDQKEQKLKLFVKGFIGKLLERKSARHMTQRLGDDEKDGISLNHML